MHLLLYHPSFLLGLNFSFMFYAPSCPPSGPRWMGSNPPQSYSLVTPISESCRGHVDLPIVDVSQCRKSIYLARNVARRDESGRVGPSTIRCLLPAARHSIEAYGCSRGKRWIAKKHQNPRGCDSFSWSVYVSTFLCLVPRCIYLDHYLLTGPHPSFAFTYFRSFRFQDVYHVRMPICTRLLLVGL